MSIVFVCALDDQQPKKDNMCGITRSVLCVKDVLNRIAIVAENISQTANEIEKYIVSKIQIDDNLYGHIDNEKDLLSKNLPTLHYHVEFFQFSNIDRKYLGDLFSEAHYAMSFYYNSIEDLVKVNNIFTFTTNSWLEEIAFNLKNGMICRYRSILNVYSYEWPLINQINRIQFSRNKHRNSPSLVHEAHSIIIAQLLRESTQKIHSVIKDLEAKYF